MAILKLNNVNAITEASGAITIPALGTVTSANLANTAIVYPAGHVIQTKTYSSDTQTYVTTTSFNTLDVIGDFKFTPLVASSDILLWACCTVQVDSGGDYIFNNFYKNASDVSETANLSGTSHGLAIVRYSSTWQVCTYSFKDTCAENSLTEKTYKIAARINSSSGSGYIGWGANCPAKMVIQEIAT